MTAVLALVQPMRDRWPPGPAIGTAAALAAAVVPLGIVAGTVAARAGPHPGVTAERDLPLVLVLLCLVGLAAGPAAAWAVREDHPGTAIGLAVATLTVALPLAAGWPWLPAGARSAVLAAGPLAVAGLAQVALRWRAPRRDLALPATWAAATAAAALHLLGYDPFADPWCARTCLAVPAVLDGMLTTRAAVRGSAALSVVAAGTATAAVAFRTAGPPSLVRACVGVALTASAAAAVVRATGWGGAATAGLLAVLSPLAVATAASAVGVVAARAARTRSAVDALLDDLARPPGEPGPGRDRLRDVHFAVPAEGRWVDRTGSEAPAPGPDGRMVVLPDSAGPAVRLLLADGTDPAEVLAGLTPARRLALTNARLTAVARARLADLQAAQRRAVSHGDSERIRIERDLHDGAQQRLVSAMLHLGSAEAHAAPVRRIELARARDEVQQALARLRHLTQGPFPAVLTDEGLLAALEDLALDSPVPVRLTVHGDVDADGDAARAAYAVVAATLPGAGTGAPGASAEVTATQADGLLRIRVAVSPPPDAPDLPPEVADRVGAARGSHSVTVGTASTTTTVVIPCGS
jgi:signal transduction histidine kinase